jgi:vacuolar-type H+-ATPase subunit E/Vma4
MAIEDILNALENQAEADVAEIMAEAHAHAGLVRSEADAEAAKIHDNFARQVERVASSDAAKIVNAARLEAKMAVSTSRGDGIQAVFDGAVGELGRIRSTGAYPDLFARLAAEALEGLSGQVVLRVDPADERLAQAAANASGLIAEVRTDLDTAGGLIVEAEGGRIVRRNTFEDRLERVRGFVQADVAKALFA